MQISALNRYFIFLYNLSVRFVVIINQYGDQRNCKSFAINK